MGYTAKKDFSYRGNEWKKGELVKAGETLIKAWVANGNIELKKTEAKIKLDIQK